MKRTICSFLAAFFIVCSAAAELPFFSGYAGILGNINNTPETEKFKPELKNKMFFAGQLDFSSKIFVRSELSVNTDNIFKTGLFTSTASDFKINELSFTWQQNSNTTSHYLSAFMGNFESIGSDVFLKRQFGIQSITSATTESFNGLCSSAVYPFYGIGASYVIHLEQPVAFGLYAYANETDEIKQKFFNTDLRFACGFSNFVFDFSAGAAFPFEQEIAETGKDAVLVVRSLTLHSGLTMLWGNRNSTSLFLQAGFSGLIYNPQNEKKITINSDDMYLLLEPRFVFRFFTFNFSLYSIPQESIDNMILLKDPLGFNLSFCNDHISVGSTSITLGLLGTLSFPEKNFMDVVENIKSIKTVLDWNKNIFVTPYASMPLLNGTLKTTVSLNVLNISKEGFGAVSASVSYKSQL